MRYLLPVLTLAACYCSGYAQIKMEKKAGGLLFTENNKEVLFFQADPKNRDGKYERCNYIHPLWGIDGNVLTEDFPADHLHHRGIFWAWHQIWIDGQRIGDGWEIRDFDQKVNDLEFLSQKDGSARLKTGVTWLSDKWKQQGRKIPYMKENAVITIHRQKGNYRKIDFEIELLALEKNLTIGGSEDIKGYSGFSVRMILPDDVVFSGPDGNVEPKNEAVNSPGYVNVSGSVGKNGSPGGIVIADLPSNPDFPQKWILRKKNSMQNAAYPGNVTIPVSTEKPLTLSYSLIVYSGKMKSGKIKKILKN